MSTSFQNHISLPERSVVNVEDHQYVPFLSHRHPLLRLCIALAPHWPVQSTYSYDTYVGINFQLPVEFLLVRGETLTLVCFVVEQVKSLEAPTRPHIEEHWHGISNCVIHISKNFDTDISYHTRMRGMAHENLRQ